MEEHDHLPHPTVIPAQPGWLIYYVSERDEPSAVDDLSSFRPDTVIAFHCATDGWTHPIVAGEQYAFKQEYILRDPNGKFVTQDCGSFDSLAEAYRQIRPTP